MSGRLTRISGPTVEAEPLGGVALYDLVRVGDEGLLGEIIRIEGDRATLQVYEDTTGLSLGEPAVPLGEPLTVELGPGLLGRIFDGMQRPLPDLAVAAGDFLARGQTAPALDADRRWGFEPLVAPGDRVKGGQLVGRAHGDGRVHGVLAPPEASGVVESVSTVDLGVRDPAVVLAGGGVIRLAHRWPVRRPRPHAGRLASDEPLLTGQRVLDCFFPVARGSAAIVPGGFGTGKTILEQSLAKFAAADVIVFVGCGERGNEMAELLDEFPHLVDPRGGRPLLERTVMVVNTSNMPVAAREASIYTGITMAEYFRDLGQHVALLIDSTSRWAEALREVSSRLGEMPGEEGYPTYLATRVAQFYERAGRVTPLAGGEGSVTLVGAVSPPGGDFSEPVTQASMRATAALWALSPELAHRRHYPAIDWGQSYSLDADRLGDRFARLAGEDWTALRTEAMRLLQQEAELQEIAQLVGVESLQDAERLVLESARLLREGFLRQSAYHAVDGTCSPRKAAVMLRLFLELHRRLAAAVAAGRPLAGLLADKLDRSLQRLAEVPEADLPAAVETARASFTAALPLEKGA